MVSVGHMGHAPMASKPPARFGGLAQTLPFTAQLLPNTVAGLEYPLKSLMLTRLLTGLERVHRNGLRCNRTPNLTETQKKQSLWESRFMELFGTPSFMAVMHLAADGMNRLLSAVRPLRPTLKPLLAQSSLSAQQIAHANHALQQVVGREQVHILPNIAFHAGRVNMPVFLQALARNGQHELAAHPELEKAAAQWFRGANARTSLCFTTGMAASALYGGFALQAINDNVMAPFIHRRLHEKVLGGAQV